MHSSNNTPVFFSAFSSLFALFLLLGLSGCRVECERYCRPLSDSEKRLTPYQFGDTVFFTDMQDTFTMICTRRDFFKDVEVYSDHYYYEKCDGGQKTYFMRLAVLLESDIPFRDTSQLTAYITSRTEFGFDDGIVTFSLYCSDSCSPRYWFSFSSFTRPNDDRRLYTTRKGLESDIPKYRQCEMEFFEEKKLNGKTYHAVHLYYDEIEGFDSVYYNTEFGFLRLVAGDQKIARLP